jgi:predicted PurR-regulated permease PerM
MNKPSHSTCRMLGLIAFAGLTLGVVLNWDAVLHIFSGVSSVFRPVILAIVIAFFINLPMRNFERWLMKLLGRTKLKYKETLCRALGMILSFLTFAAILTLAVSLLYPQLRDSITLLVHNLPAYETNLIDWAQTYLPDLDLATRISEGYAKMLEGIPKLVSTIAPHLYSFTASAASVVTDSVIALVLSFYFLISKDKLVRQVKTIVRTYAPRAAKRVLPIATMLNDKFRRFLGGQLTEAAILGMLCFIGMSVLGLPYAPLVSTLVGVTAVIPIFGAFIGTIPSAFIILMDNPLQSLIFIIFIIALQQVEGNFIYPRVVGDSIGLSGLWVLLAVVIGGGFWGIPGIFVGIPVMSAVYDIVRSDLKRRKEEAAQKAPPLEEKG